jgi:3-hydroxymyristoyl/3-hydroxydecanoyl-(acyl carrier protein) dehydratase
MGDSPRVIPPAHPAFGGRLPGHPLAPGVAPPEAIPSAIASARGGKPGPAP